MSEGGVGGRGGYEKELLNYRDIINLWQFSILIDNFSFFSQHCTNHISAKMGHTHIAPAPPGISLDVANIPPIPHPQKCSMIIPPPPWNF